MSFGGSRISGRKNLLMDERLWTISTKIEILYQKSVLDLAIYLPLNRSRKALNNFIHKGLKPQKESVDASIEGLFHMVSLLISEFTDSNLLPVCR